MNDAERPTPEQMLARLKAEGEPGVEERRRGRLKVFFGYAAGVGKTYAMLQEARRLQAAGEDVVVGYVEPHGRPETEALLAGLEQLPVRQVPYHGTVLREFDLDAALVRRPAVILVDELAHTNAPGLRHAKRWQDVEELLAAGIDVDTTCNVQHVESLNDVVAQISGVTVSETVPDDVFLRADELALIDLPPDDLLERLQEGKVYIPAQAERALRNFFRKENLVALRELALRRTAERVHVDVQTARTGRGALAPWATGERLLVCVGPSPTSAKVIRAAKRLANALQADLMAVHVENAATARLSEKDRSRLLAHLRLAERLGAETVTLTGDDLVTEALQFARLRNVTKIVIGKSEPVRGWFRRAPTVTDRLIHESGDIDVYVIRGAGEPHPETALKLRGERVPLSAWVGTAAVLLACTAVSLLWWELGWTEANLVMTYLVGVIVVGARYGRWPSVAASILSVLMFDILFTEPYYTVIVEDSQYAVTFLVMLSVGLVTSTLMTRIRRQAVLAQASEQRTTSLYELSRKLAALADTRQIAAFTERIIAEVFDAEAIVLLPHDGSFQPVVDHRAAFAADASEIAVAQWVYDRGQPAGRGTDTLPAARALYLPLTTADGTRGVLAVRHEDADRFLIPQTRRLLETYASLIAAALERAELIEESRAAEVRAETERLRSTLLASVSHDIRTPLAVIAGASSSLLEERGTPVEPSLRRELLATIFDEADRLTHLVENLLRLTQLSAGKFQLQKEWHPVEDVIGSALNRLKRSLQDRPINVSLPDELLMGQFDATLIEQVLVNLFENALRYTPHGTPLAITGRPWHRGIVLEVADRGPGLVPDEIDEIFETFQRGRSAPADSRGAGLGLAICRAIVEAHGGQITAANREGGGAVFTLELPADGPPPVVTLTHDPEGAAT